MHKQNFETLLGQDLGERVGCLGGGEHLLEAVDRLGTATWTDRSVWRGQGESSRPSS